VRRRYYGAFQRLTSKQQVQAREQFLINTLYDEDEVPQLTAAVINISIKTAWALLTPGPGDVLTTSGPGKRASNTADAAIAPSN
jgi:hypothetical protein